MTQQYFEFLDLPASKTQLKRSNALRIKANNFELLPYSLRQSLLELRSQLQRYERDSDGKFMEKSGRSGQQVEEEETEEEEAAADELSLFEQIRHGVKLRPIDMSKAKLGRQSSLREHEETLASLLMKVLSRRYAAIQQIDNDQEDDQSDSSSMGSFSASPNCAQSAFTFHQYHEDDGDCNNLGAIGSRGTKFEIRMGARNRAAKGLLERLDDYELTLDLTNDVTVRL